MSSEGRVHGPFGLIGLGPVGETSAAALPILPAH
jgi:hypothetical protein